MREAYWLAVASGVGLVVVGVVVHEVGVIGVGLFVAVGFAYQLGQAPKPKR